MLSKEEIIKKVGEVKHWFHKIDLGQGVVTPGWKSCDDFHQLNLPDLRGKTVLDVGCWDGLYSFECEKRGAKRVLATDHYVWHVEGFGGIKGFLTAREILNSNVEYKDIDVFDISPETVGEWDIVLFLGVFYHLKNPLLALEKLSKVTRHLLVVESHIVITPFHNNVPIMEFYETDELNNDPTNWWGPNLKCLVQTVRSSGFEYVEVQKQKKKIHKRAILYELARILTLGKLRIPLCPARAIVHAWKSEEHKKDFFNKK